MERLILLYHTTYSILRGHTPSLSTQEWSSLLLSSFTSFTFTSFPFTSVLKMSFSLLSAVVLSDWRGRSFGRVLLITLINTIDEEDNQKLTNFSLSPHLAFSSTYESFTFHNVPHLTAKQLLGNGTQVLIGYAGSQLWLMQLQLWRREGDWDENRGTPFGLQDVLGWCSRLEVKVHLSLKGPFPLSSQRPA